MLKLNFLVNDKYSILSCLKLFKKNKQNILCVINRDKKFLGIITISDIRNALINGAKLKTK